MDPAIALPLGAVSRGVVLAVAGDAAMVRLRSGAVVRVSLDEAPVRAGDVLIVASDADGWFVLPAVLRAPDGSTARMEGDGLVVRDPAGRPVVEHRGGVLAVHATGDLALSAAGRVSVRGDRGVTLECEGTSVALAPAGLDVRGPAVDVASERGALRVEEVTLRAVRVETSIERLEHIVGVVQVEADRVIERARRVYREVEELSHLRAGRIRAIAEGAMHLMSKRVVMKADEDVAIKGEKIHLA